MTRGGAVPTITTMTAAAEPAILDESPIDSAATEQFAGRVFELVTGAGLSALIDVGHRTGLFEAAALGPGTSQDLADRAGLHERYVREWLGGLVTGGIFEYEPSTRSYWLPREHAACLTGPGPQNLATLPSLTTMLTRHVADVAAAFRDGGGVPYRAYAPEVHDVLDSACGPVYEHLLLPEILPLAPGLRERLAAGARVADVACGTGKALAVLAREFPRSTFVGYDIDGAALARARAAAERSGLRNVRHEQRDAASLTADEPFDVVFVFNAIHDQADPAAVLRRIRDLLAPGGVFVMDEPAISSALEENVDNPVAPFIYAISTLHCLPASLAEGGAGLGTAWGRQVALRMLAEAGFGDVAVHDLPQDPGNAVFVTHRP
jgi:SAM-dependent methyltransferase